MRVSRDIGFAAARWRRILPFVLLALVRAAPLLAQRADVIITAPREWRDGQSVGVIAGATLRVTGVVGASGTALPRVTVAGVRATVRRDEEGLINFEAAVPVPAGTTEIVIRVEPDQGTPFSRNFKVSVTAPSAGVQQPRIGNPWKPFAFRGVAYAGLVGAGVVLMGKEETASSHFCRTEGATQDCFTRLETTKPQQSLGVGLVGGAAALVLLDVLLTSKRAKAYHEQQRGQGQRDVRDAGVRLGPPELQLGPDGATSVALRLRF
jgi:hypothetical protein